MSKKAALKKIAQSSLLFLVVASLAAPATHMYAQSATPSVVSGGDPEPTGEPDVTTISAIAILLAMPVS